MIANNRVFVMPDVQVRCANEAELLAELADYDAFAEAVPCFQFFELGDCPECGDVPAPDCHGLCESCFDEMYPD